MRRLENEDEEKFWEAWIKDDLIFCYKYGKIGANGHLKIKKFKSRAEAEAALEAALSDKLDEGFSEIGGEDEDDEDDAPAKPAAKGAAAKKKSDDDDDDDDDSDDDEDSDEDDSDDDEDSDDEEESDDEDSEEEESDDEDSDDEDSEEEESDDEDSDDEEESDEDSDDEEDSEEEESDDEDSDDEDSDDEDSDDEDSDDEEDSDDDDSDDDDAPRKKPAKAVKVYEPEPEAEPEKPAYPPRVAARMPTPEGIAKATEALVALKAAVGGRSWKLGRAARRARHALEGVGGLELARDAKLNAALEEVMALVIAPKKRLPLEDALTVLWVVDASSFARVVKQWRAKMLDSAATPAIGVLAATLEGVSDPELAIHVGTALVNRRLSADSFRAWFGRLRPFLTDDKFLTTLKAGNDAMLAARLKEVRG